jgi:hypothetical protein
MLLKNTLLNLNRPSIEFKKNGKISKKLKKTKEINLMSASYLELLKDGGLLKSKSEK